MTHLTLTIAPTPTLPESAIKDAIKDAADKGITPEKWVENAFIKYLDRPRAQKSAAAKPARKQKGGAK